MSRFSKIRFRIVCLILTAAMTICPSATACTLAVISGRVTQDHRPILWKNRDFSSAPRNEVAILTDGKYRVVAVFNAGSRTSVWMGQNAAGLCIGNSLSNDLRNGKNNEGLRNGQFMKAVLQSCATIKDVIAYLQETNQTGRRTIGNFGIIDADGGAAMFEIGPDSFAMFDANDPNVAPEGYIARSNFSTTANNLPPLPTSDECDQIASAGRYCRACDLFSSQTNGVTFQHVLHNMTRDLALKGNAISGSINAEGGVLPEVIATENTISRSTTVSAAVFHGVKQNEDPQHTTMWVTLGDPKFSVAVPCWTNMKKVADAVEGARGGEIGEAARTLRDACLTQSSGQIQTRHLVELWRDLWPLEKDLIQKTLTQREEWLAGGFDETEATLWHAQAAQRAFDSMQKELLDTKERSLKFSPSEQPDSIRKGPLRIAVYDHSDGEATGPKNLAKILTPENGFEIQTITPEEIQSGGLVDFDVLVMPGGSGSKQSGMLKEEGRTEVRKFVEQGGGYVGICAGSYLASSHYSWSLDLINAKVWDRAHWARGTGMVQLELTPRGNHALDLEANTQSVYYGQGPLMVPGDDPDLPAYEVLAEYKTEIVANGAIKGVMKDTHAIVRSAFGEGRVVCFSPHPERPGGPNQMILQGVRWAASPKTD